MSQLKGIEITLRPIAGGINRVLPPGINQIVQQEYANKYLESIGAYPTKDNIEFVLNNLAIKDALVLPVWARSKIIIIPGMNNKEGEMGQSMQEFLSENTKEKVAVRRTDKNIKNRRPKKSSNSVNGSTGDYDEQEEMNRNAKSSYTNLVGRRLSWTTVNTLDLIEPLVNVLQVNRRIAESFKVLMKPPQFNLEDIQDSLYLFITSLPDYVPRVKHDKTFQLFKAVRKLLKSKECVQLYGLLIHFCYWNIIHPTARHTIQSLRDRHPSAQTGVFNDLDLTTQGMLQMRNAPTAPAQVPPQSPLISSLPGRNQSRSALSVEKMFAVEMFNGTDDAVQVIQMNDSSPSRSRAASAAAGADSELFRGIASERMEFHSRPGSPEFDVSTKSNSEKLGIPSRPSSPGLETTSGSKKVEFNVSRPSRSRSPTAGSAMDFEDGNGSVEESLTSAYGRMDGQQVGAGVGPGGGGGSLAGVSVETEASLSAFEKEQLFIQLEACLINLFKKVGKKRIDLVTGRQALVSCCHFVVDDALTSAYPWFAALPEDAHPHVEHKVHMPAYQDYANRGADYVGPYDDSIKKLNLRLRRLVHQGMADIIDPSRLYTSSMLLTSLTGKVQNVSLATKGKSRFYTTSVATKSLLGDTHSDAARRFIQQGRGVYTVLPGVVDAYDSRPQTGRPTSASNENFFDILRQQQAEPIPTPVEPHRHYLNKDHPHEPHTEWAPRIEGTSKFAHNKFGDVPRQRPATTTGVSRNPSRAASATRSGQNRGGTANAALHPNQAPGNAPKRLDFMNLFSDQPDAGYFPVLKAGKSAADQAAHAASSKANDWLDEFLPPGSRCHSAKNRSEEFGEPVDPDIGMFDKGMRPRSANFGYSRKVATASSYPAEPEVPLQTSQMFPSGESVSSNSYLSDNRSIAHNKAASMPLSLRAKASLMELMVDKTTALYATDIQTNLVRTRLALLKPTM